MGTIQIPDGYKSPQTIRETEVAIKEVKDYFERALADALSLTRVSAPLFVKPESGLNDNLNGVERPTRRQLRSYTPWQNGREWRFASTASIRVRVFIPI